MAEKLTLPSPLENQTYVTISALEGGSLTLPESLFITDADPTKRTTVPSLCFLIRHTSPSTSKTTNLVFDLGLKRDCSKYTESQQHHIAQRQPTSTSPDVADSLRKGGVQPEEVDIVVLSHVHWDHIGTPSDFPTAKFVVGSGTLDLLANGGGYLYPKELFNHDELPFDRTYELPPVDTGSKTAAKQQTSHKWEKLPGFGLDVVDYFNDGSVYIVDAPGHLFGHVNLLARAGEGRWVYLGGDCCHDVRILRGEKGIALYSDGCGGTRSVHVDTEAARGTIGAIGRLMREVQGVEVVVAHDGGWREANGGRFLPGTL
ncbi:Metallo-hydrolase/oxidoreductase [Stipitochalara longipes BDJ]|nr:Metallo-hydrolase/oxidoreductase [Stipitochalara longipes BDJ]